MHTVQASAFPFCCSGILSSFVTGACRGSVLFIIQTRPASALFTAGRAASKSLWPSETGVRGAEWRASTRLGAQQPCNQREGTEELALTDELSQTTLAGLFCIPLPFNLMTSHGEPGVERKAELRSAFVPLGLKHWEAPLRALGLVSSDAITLCYVDGRSVTESIFSSIHLGA